MQPITDTKLYAAHLEELQRRYDSALESANLEAVVIGAGQPAPIFMDDQHLPFKANPHLVQWVPLLKHPDSILCYRKGDMPDLVVFKPADFWFQNSPLPEFIKDAPLNVLTVSSGVELLEHVKKLSPRTAFIGEIREQEDSFGLKRINPQKLLDELHFGRAIKTPWEVECVRHANHLAIRGHLAAELCFNEGGSEYDIQLAFRTACRVTDEEMPYPAIVAINEHAAALHYQHLDREPGDNRSLLIDAGCAVNGYASDITRTYSDDPVFGLMIEAMHELQRELCIAAEPGADYRELHIAAHHSIAALLKEVAVIDMSPEEAVETTVSRSFFPHGLGHFLGLQVHDVGALLANAKGDEAPRPDNDPYLRLTRILEPGNVLTVEPGLYFIDMLLEKLREAPEGKHVNWGRVDELRTFGGIRIEDNLHITESGNENLTREAFAAVTAN
ncbi:MAG: Xaa-Pro dipeptidase [Chromatiales bacterium]|jgi:Xaa-Pro dipeptidase|nr:Xaa-Pro dipeptidase [Chromatiales bacterium]MDP6151527.1 Xaa-Pro dipeptidase [Gammaproteobacteria bacterium]MDP7093441.1 Xaa-Pro dipeptidase [Gammaproteobacteria bacterium]MDP7271455.1 Xaa-Pro dipeptidase [Gammaproteobacteria bacterium]HJP05697.1 Xaa-Pro dipeptidase [Gammaproteobacteria bacterium]